MIRVCGISFGLFVRRYIGWAHAPLKRGKWGGFASNLPFCLPMTPVGMEVKSHGDSCAPGKRSTIIRVKLNYYKI